MNQPTIILFSIAVTGLLLNACQFTTEPYRRGERVAAVPSNQEVKEFMADTPIQVDPQMATVLAALHSLKPKPIQSLSAEEARNQPTIADAVLDVLDGQGQSTAPQPVGKIQNRSIPGPGGPIPIRVYTPHGIGPFPIVVYYHGGGWVIATIDTYDASARALCNAANAIVVSVEYRKAPEHRFPAAHEDAYAAYDWMRKHGQDINGDPSMVAVAGESTGGNLAGAVSMIARQRNQALPVHQILIYPVTGSDMDTPSYRKHEQAQPLNKAMMSWFFEKYLYSPADANNPVVALIKAQDLRGLPPATIITAGIDPLESDGKDYAARLREAGVPVIYQQFYDVTHEFFGTGAVVEDAKYAAQLVGRELKHAFLMKHHPLQSSALQETP
ncbi:MAG TPA: alpha/beta hydrolase [Nitrospiraceae bacterium]